MIRSRIYNKFAVWRKPQAVHENGEGGFGLIEILVGMVILAIIALAVTKSMIIGFHASKLAIRSGYAMHVAQEQMEIYFATDPSTLDSSDSFSDTRTHEGIQFNRTVTITVNADRTRTIDIDIEPTNTTLGGTISISNSFALWGMR